MNLQEEFDKIDSRITKFMDRIGLTFLRYSVAIIFIWFGILKPFGLSPAQALVEQTVVFLILNGLSPFSAGGKF